MDPFRIQNSTELILSMASVGEDVASHWEVGEASTMVTEVRRGLDKGGGGPTRSR